MEEIAFEPSLEIEEPAEPAEPGAEEPAEPAEPGAEEPAEPAEARVGEEEPADGRRVPDDVRKALKAFRDSSPENAKAARALNDAYGREQAYKQVFPSVKDAQAAQSTLQTIETMGGLDGVRATIAEIEEIDGLLQAGDAKAVDKILEVAGTGAEKIVPAMLDKFRTSNPDAYAAAIRPHLVSAIGSTGLTEAFGDVMRALEIANTPGATPEFKAKFDKQASDKLAAIHQFLTNLGKEKPQSPQPAGVDPKLAERETQLAQREAAAFKTEISGLANPKLNASMSKALAPYVKGLTKEQRRDFANSVYAEVEKLVNADKNYQASKDALFKSKTKDAGKIAALMTSKFDTELPKAVKSVAALRRYGATPASPKSGQQAAPVAGNGSIEKPIPVDTLPGRNDVDWEKTTEDLMIRGIRVLKSGKVVRLKR